MKWLRSIAGASALAATCFASTAQTAIKENSISDLYNAVKSETEVDRMETLVKEMEKKYAGSDDYLVNVSRQILASLFAEKKNADRAAYWTNRITEPASKDYTAYSVIDELIEKDMYADAEKMLTPIWERYQTSQPPTGNERNIYPRLSASDFETLNGILLYKKGEYKKSLSMLAPLAETTNMRGNGRRAEYYAMALAQSGETGKALEEMNKLLLAPGHRSAAFKAEAARVFRISYGSTNRYDQLMDSLTMAEKKKMESKIEKMAVYEPAPDFTLTDLNGRTVSLQSLRGKTVILDFWATWCQPCVASFPGMQLAVDHFRNDSSVVFMFIHTAEHSADPIGDVKRFMANKKYRFYVYMDLRNKETKKNAVGDLFKVHGIPAKFIIDKDGMIRYKNSGYLSEEEAVLEIGTMLENIRKTTNPSSAARSSRGKQQFNELAGIRDKALLQQKLNTFVNSEKEQDMLLAFSWYYFNKEQEKAADVLREGLKKFPKGELAYTDLSLQLNDKKTIAEKEQLLGKIMREYSEKQVSPLALYDLSIGLAATGNKEKAWLYLDLLKTSAGSAIYYNALSRVAITDPVRSGPLLKQLVDSLEKKLPAPAVLNDTAMKRNKEIRRTISLYNAGLSAYSETLIANGKADQAYQIMSGIYRTDLQGTFKNAYLKTLLATRRLKEAFPLIEDAIRANTASPDIKAKYRETYKAVHGSYDGFKEHEKQLLLSIKEMIRQESIRHAVKEPAPLWTLNDVDGKTVALADLKGKVVVMDFWATWCGPCKASFPSMQLAVDKYKNDPNVKFVYIHTWEKGEGDPTKKAKEYVINNKYSFHVLMDLRIPSTQLSKIAEQYKVQGIPTKIVIDPSGNIRFSVSGFNRIPEVAVEELSAMIEFAKVK